MKVIATWLNHRDVSCWNFMPVHKQKIENSISGIKVIICPDKDSFLKALQDADTVFVWTFKQEWLELAPKLKRIITPAAGKDFLIVDPPAGISVEYSSFHGKLIGETVMGMMLGHARGIFEAYRLQDTAQWPRKELDTHMTLLRGKQITILGFGSIGSSIAEMAKPFGARICGIRRTAQSRPEYFSGEDRIAGIDEIDSILPDTDHLVLCLPRTEATTDIISKSRINLLPRHAVIYNVGRGNSIDEADLVDALESHRIAAAYLDVFREEPLPPDSPLRSCHNCFIMPHASVFAPEFMDFFVEEFLSLYGNNSDYD